jgi:6-phosphofructokinase 2
LGQAGAMLVTATQAWRADSLQVDVQTTIGAGDSFLAAMVWALNEGHPLAQAFRYGMAGGAAALLSPGTPLSQAADIHRLVGDVTLREI